MRSEIICLWLLASKWLLDIMHAVSRDLAVSMIESPFYMAKMMTMSLFCNLMFLTAIPLVVPSVQQWIHAVYTDPNYEPLLSARMMSHLLNLNQSCQDRICRVIESTDTDSDEDEDMYCRCTSSCSDEDGCCSECPEEEHACVDSEDETVEEVCIVY